MSTVQVIERHPLYIGGEQVETTHHTTITLPFDGSPVAQVYEGDQAAMLRAIAAAQDGARAMAGLTNAERSDLLLRLHALLIEEAEDFARVICHETGKPIKEARVETDRASQTVLAAAIEARNLRGEVVPMDAAPSG